MFLNIDPRKFICYGLLFAFFVNILGPAPARADDFHLPSPGTLVVLSPEFNPPILKGLKVHPDNPFRFDFILDQGDNSTSLLQRGGQGELKQQAAKLIKYFLASLTIPEKDLWVNLSPYEKNRIVPESFGLTEMGRDLLAEDYMLKQITASLIYPEGETGRKFWKRIYAEAAKKFGTTNIPVNTFNKVWIVPEKAVVYENAKAGTAYVVESKLKVMLEEDYLSLSRHQQNKSHSIASQVIRDIVIPELTKEVNEDKNFSQLRQVYNSLILATWYKKKIKDSILAQVYADKNKVAGIASLRGSVTTEGIYQRYLQAFKKGVYNYIKEDQDPLTQQTIPRKYFSGGEMLININEAMQVTRSAPNNFSHHGDLAVVASQINGISSAPRGLGLQDRAMTAEQLADGVIDYFLGLKRNEDIIMWKRIIKNDQGFPMAPEEFLTGNKIDEGKVNLFAQVLNQKWKQEGSFDGRRSFAEALGPIFELVPILYISRGGSTEELWLRHQLLDCFLRSDAFSLSERALGQSLVVLSHVTHLGFYGLHPETKEPVFIDNDLLISALEAYLSTLIQLSKEELAQVLPGRDGKFNPLNITLEDFLLWVLILGIDPSIHALSGQPTADEIAERTYTTEQVLEHLYGTTDLKQVMVKAMQKAFTNKLLADHANKDKVAELLRRALSIPEDEFERKGFKSPYRYGVQKISLKFFFLADAFPSTSAWSEYPLKDHMLMFPFVRPLLPSYVLDKAAGYGDVRDVLEPSQDKERNLSLKLYPNGLKRQLYIDIFTSPELAGIIPERVQGILRNSKEVNVFADRRLAFSPSDQHFLSKIHGMRVIGNNGEKYLFEFNAQATMEKLYVDSIQEDMFDIKHIDQTNGAAEPVGWLKISPLNREGYIGNDGRLHLAVEDVQLQGGHQQQGIYRAFLDMLDEKTELKGKNIINVPTLRYMLIAILEQGSSNMIFDPERIKEIQDIIKKVNVNDKYTRPELKFIYHFLYDYQIMAQKEGSILKGFDSIFKESPLGRVMERTGFHDQHLIFSPEDGILCLNSISVKEIQGSRAMMARGGIDFTAAKTPLQVQNSGGEIKFHLDPAQLAQLQNAPGFVPVIISIQPLTNIREFLGISP